MGSGRGRQQAGEGSLLDHLSADALAQLKRGTTTIRFPAGACIFEEGDPADSLYVIEAGLVDVISSRRPDQPLALLGPGESFGEQSLLSGRRRSAAAVARSDAVVSRLSHADFLAVLATVPEVGAAVAALLSDRLRTTSELSVGVPRGIIVVLTIDRGAPTGSTGSGEASSPELEYAGARLAQACATLLGSAIVLDPTCDPSRPRRPAGGPRRLDLATADPVAGVTVSTVSARSVVPAAVRAARDHAVVVVPWPGFDDRGAPAGLLDASDWSVVVAVSEDAGRPSRSTRQPSGALVIGSGEDQVRAAARLICRRRLGVALGSGSIRGFAHAGVLGVLSDHHVPVDVMAGASAGAIAAALYLSGHDPRQMADLSRALVSTLRTGLPSLAGFSMQALLSGRRLRTYLDRALGAATRIEDLAMPLIIAATDLDTRAPVHLDAGPLVEAVAASAAIPGVFPPVSVAGRRLADGGTTDPLPVGALRDHGADVVVAVNVMGISTGMLGIGPARLPLPVPPVLENLFVSLDAISAQLATESCRLADIVVSPRAPATSWYDVVPAGAYRAAGEEAMRASVLEVLALVGGPGPTP